MYAGGAALAALAGVTVLLVLERTAQSQTASRAPTQRAGLAAATTSSKIAFLSTADLGHTVLGASELYLVNPDGTGRRRLLATLTGTKTGGLSPWQTPVWSPDGRELLYGRGDYRQVMKPDGSGQRRLARNAGSPAWSPDGRTIACSRYNGDIPYLWVMNADGSGQRQVTPDGVGGIAWSPDGRRIAFVGI